jgi:hypothetical protein
MPHVGAQTGLASVPQAPGFLRPSLSAQVSDRYSAGRYGVDAEVQIPAGDAELMSLMLRAAALLQELGTRMNGFQGHLELTRANIRSCRSLAIDLQEEVEIRRGPQATR